VLAFFVERRRVVGVVGVVVVVGLVGLVVVGRHG
jgi:hypothetical protein